MCGIVGYVGKEDALPIIIAALERLEYRGYDSAGVAIYEQGEIRVTRAVGKVIELKRALQSRKPNPHAGTGIGHTRWATHGKPAEHNAHPHSAGRVSLIHNGIIENYIELRERLQKSGSKFLSETDTEIAAHLLNSHLQKGLAPFDALKATCGEIRGSYAFVAIDAKNPDRLLVAKSASPIIVGIGDGEVFVASDIPAVLPHTRKVIVLEDGDIAEVRLNGVTIENGGKVVLRPVQQVTWDVVTAQKGGYKHFMLKEIHEQGVAIANTFRGRIELDPPRIIFPDLQLSDADIKDIDRVVFLAMGTARHACMVGKVFFELFAGIPCEVEYGSEFRYASPVLNRKTLVIAISQSGETADTLAAVELAAKKARTLAICNVLGSSLVRRVEHIVYTQAGPEISVASTKAFTTQLVAVYMLALLFGSKRGVISTERLGALIKDLVHLPAAIDETLKVEPLVEKAAKQFYKAKNALFLGRGLCCPIAFEGALKLKEISYIHAEGYPAGEMKHGPIALIDANMPVVVMVQKSSVLFEKVISNMREVDSREGQIITITDIPGNRELDDLSEFLIEVPHLSEELSCLLLTIPLQLFAYHVAVLNGTDVDLPRNLAKSVTVE